jgi:hypothetical protein
MCTGPFFVPELTKWEIADGDLFVLRRWVLRRCCAETGFVVSGQQPFDPATPRLRMLMIGKTATTGSFNGHAYD